MDPELKETKITPQNDHVARCVDGSRSVDRISALPDVCLLHMLSFLGTKKAATTSVLSTRWRFLFASLPDIDLDLSFDSQSLISPSHQNSKGIVADYPLDQCFYAFMNFGYRILILRNGASIRKFKLSLHTVHHRYLAAIQSLISAALLCKVGEIDISVDNLSAHSSYCIRQVSFAGISSCKTLVSLGVDCRPGGYLNVPSNVWLPNLKSMRIGVFWFEDEDSIQRLIQGCPVLQELDLIVSGFKPISKTVTEQLQSNTDHVRVAIMSSSSLLRLKLECGTGEYTVFLECKSLESFDYSDYCVRKHKIILVAPNLKYLAYSVDRIGECFVESPNGVVGAKLRICYWGEEDSIQVLYDHLHRLQNVVSLSLEQNILKALHYCERPFPVFENVTKLELRSLSCWKVLPTLFGCSPNLQELILGEVAWNGDLQEFEQLLQQVILPCFIQHLKEVEICRFRREECEFKLIEYLLHNGKALAKMTLGMTSPVPERLLSVKKYSKHCHVRGKGMMIYYPD